MKPKKNPTKDLNKNRNLYFFAGLTLVMLLAYVALEWRTYTDSPHGVVDLKKLDELPEEIPPPILLKTPPPPPPPVAPPVIEIAPDDDNRIETKIMSTEPNQDEKILKAEDIIFEETPEDIPLTWISIEEVPVFPGCEDDKDKRACFQKMIQKHINKTFRYPEIAQEMGTEGKVYTMFVIQKDGTIGNVQMRGPDKNLEAEAARIIKELPRMIPGKQRGTAVKVPFSIPITFRLQ